MGRGVKGGGGVEGGREGGVKCGEGQSKGGGESSVGRGVKGGGGVEGERGVKCGEGSQGGRGSRRGEGSQGWGGESRGTRESRGKGESRGRGETHSSELRYPLPSTKLCLLYTTAHTSLHALVHVWS